MQRGDLTPHPHKTIIITIDPSQRKQRSTQKQTAQSIRLKESVSQFASWNLLKIP